MDTLTTHDMVGIIDRMAEVIIDQEVYFCELDSAAGDGDFGMSLAKGFKELKREWASLPKETIGRFLKECGMLITEHCGGASGPIWGSAFRAMGKYAAEKTELNLTELAELFQSAVNGVQKRGKAKLGDKTLLDALIPAAESLKESAVNGEDISTAMKKSADCAVKGAEKTKEFAASKGRASYLGERSINHPDAGATAIGVILTALTSKC